MNTQAETPEVFLTESIIKNLKKVNFYNEEDFLKDAAAYINAIKENRMINVIGNVSASGMSRTLKFTSCEKNERTGEFYQRNYFALFKALGYTPVKNSSYFRVYGCGMDMVFATHYDILYDFKRIGLISEEECDKLAQRTPTTI